MHFGRDGEFISASAVGNCISYYRDIRRVPKVGRLWVWQWVEPTTTGTWQLAPG